MDLLPSWMRAPPLLLRFLRGAEGTPPETHEEAGAGETQMYAAAGSNGVAKRDPDAGEEEEEMELKELLPSGGRLFPRRDVAVMAAAGVDDMRKDAATAASAASAAAADAADARPPARRAVHFPPSSPVSVSVATSSTSEAAGRAAESAGEEPPGNQGGDGRNVADGDDKGGNNGACCKT